MAGLDGLDSLFRGIAVLFLAGFVLGVDGVAYVGRFVLIFNDEQSDGFLATFHSACGIDTWPHIKHKVRDGDDPAEDGLFFQWEMYFDACLFQDGLDAHAWKLVDHFESEMG